MFLKYSIYRDDIENALYQVYSQSKNFENLVSDCPKNNERTYLNRQLQMLSSFQYICVV